MGRRLKIRKNGREPKVKKKNPVILNHKKNPTGFKDIKNHSLLCFFSEKKAELFYHMRSSFIQQNKTVIIYKICGFKKIIQKCLIVKHVKTTTVPF